MRAKVARRIRNEVYGDKSPRSDAREYFAKPIYTKARKDKDGKFHPGRATKQASNTIIADAHRRLFQEMKRRWVHQGA
jgi:hypothetical protein